MKLKKAGKILGARRAALLILTAGATGWFVNQYLEGRGESFVISQIFQVASFGFIAGLFVIRYWQSLVGAGCAIGAAGILHWRVAPVLFAIGAICCAVAAYKGRVKLYHPIYKRYFYGIRYYGVTYWFYNTLRERRRLLKERDARSREAYRRANGF